VPRIENAPLLGVEMALQSVVNLIDPAILTKACDNDALAISPPSLAQWPAERLVRPTLSGCPVNQL
jgi:hypothetical protein